jgi:hypothetical protein
LVVPDAAKDHRTPDQALDSHPDAAQPDTLKPDTLKPDTLKPDSAPLPSGEVRCDFNRDGNTDLVTRNKTTGELVVWLMKGTLRTSAVTIEPTVADLNWDVVGTGDFNRDGNVDLLWRHKATGEVSVWFMAGTTRSSFVAVQPLVADLNWDIVGTGDFNKDGNVDLLWRNKATGEVSVWYMNGTAQLGTAQVQPAVADLSWEIVGTGHFNTDGNIDLLWRNKASGANGVWFMNGVTQTSTATVAQVADLSWDIVGTGDFDNDGKVDLVWRNKSSSYTAVWFMNGAAETGAAYFQPDMSWQPAAIGDFTSDGHADLMWRNVATGELSIWFLKSGVLVNAVPVAPAVTDFTWECVGTGDFNKDGNVDILWRNSATGDNAVWLMNGATRTGVVTLQAAGAPWIIVGTGDFNKDGNVDILWRNATTGDDAVWYMSGKDFSSSASLDPVADLGWEIVATGDFNKDGSVDLLWRHKVSAAVGVWYMNGIVQVSTATILPAVPSLNWEIVGAAEFNADGNVDILWNNKANGNVDIWSMNGSTYVTSIRVRGQVANLDWKVIAR